MTCPNKEPIAIIGSGCRFPGDASTPCKLWELLQEPKDVLSRIPHDRFNPTGFYHPDGLHHGTSNVQESYFLSENLRQFDAQFFGIKPVEANAIDPQQKLLIETVYESLESAGLPIKSLSGSDTSVFVGLMCEDYSIHIRRDPDITPIYTATGIARSIISNRISYFFDWHGPSVTIDTACSSSLVAVHQAVQSLRSGESRIAVAAGANLILTPELYIAESNLKMLSPGSRSRMWDADADGYARGEGIAAIVLKPLGDAIRDGDDIECIIRETGVNQDGRTKGITMPSAAAQTDLILATYRKAGLDITNPRSKCQYFEAHGTGTPAGDPQEAEAISKAFFGSDGKTFGQDDRLYVGSIKTVIGHTEGTAGLAGLLKASLAIQHGIIPPNLHFNQLSPSVAPFYTNLEIPCKATPWPVLPKGEPRRASVNSFGFGGTNAHAILESFTPSTSGMHERVSSCRQSGVVFTPFTFSAASERSLALTAKAFSAFLRDNPVNLRDLSYTLHSRRSDFAFKTSFSASSIESLCAAIDGRLDETAKKDKATLGVRSSLGPAPLSILGVFTGQGAQWASMGRRFIMESEFVRKSVDNFDHVLAQLPAADRPQWSIKDELLADDSKSRLSEAALSQPLCTAIQIILVDLLRSAGITFKAVVGHSSGEIAAAYAAGFLKADDALKIAYYRGLYAKLASNGKGLKGSMLAVSTSLEDAEEICELPDFEGRVRLAANNSPSSVTLSGDADAIDEVKQIFEKEGKFARLLRVDTAYHSHHMISCSEPYSKSLRACKIEVDYKGGSSCSWFSSVYGGKIMDALDGLECAYWKDNMVKPVLFAQALRAAATKAEAGTYDLALEVGPHPALQGPVLQTIQDTTSLSIPYYGTLSRGKDDIESLSDMLGFVWMHGGQSAINFTDFDLLLSGEQQFRLLKNLPAYSWEHDREYWIESRASKAFRSRSAPFHELLGTRCIDTADEYRWRNNLREREIPWLSGHKLQGQTIFPAAAYVSTALEAAKVLAESREIKLIELHDFFIGRAISFDDDDTGVETLVTLTKLAQPGSKNDVILADFKYHSSTSSESETMALNASGRMQIILGAASPGMLPPRSPPAPNLISVNSDLFYSTLQNVGYEYTGHFRALSSMKRSLGFGTGIVTNPPFSSPEDCFMVHPAMLDAALQASFLAFCWPGDGSLRELYVPTEIKRIRMNPVLCQPNLFGDRHLPLDSMTSSHESSKIIADVNIYAEDGQTAMLQVEGICVTPFSTAVPGSDRQMFSHWVWGVDSPDGNVAVNGDCATAEEFEIASITEQAAVYYLKHLREIITQDEIDRSEWHHKKLFEFADHILSGVSTGSQRFSKKHWLASTHEEVYSLMAKYPNSIELKLVQTVGEHLPEAVRGNTNILEHLMQDNLLNNFYEQGHGIIEHTEFCAKVVEQIVHRYPNMKMLEIGAGTGGATKRIFKRIGQKFSSYTFTDISTGFFEKAQEIFSGLGDKIIFKSLDCEKDILSQGYVEHSYDLVIASLVLHATEYLENTMNHVRRLLKPGGFLVMLELTADGPMRLGFCMSGLPGWWLGHKDGRNLSPLATSAQWHSILQRTGFSGVDAITPEVDVFARPCFVIATQAVDDKVNFLRQPLQSPRADIDIQELVILGGVKLETMRLVDRLAKVFQPWCNRITKVRTLTEMTDTLMSPRSHVISLADLDEPIFKSISDSVIEGLKQLLNQSKTLLWVTRGCREVEPYANMSIGFGRTLALEMSFVRTQFFDIDPSQIPDANSISETMLRLCAADSWEPDEPKSKLLWSIEPEMVQQHGMVLIPRLYYSKEANDRYNSARRFITKEVDLKASPVTLFNNGSSYAFRNTSPLSKGSSLTCSIVVQVQYSILSSIRLPSSGYYFIVFGSNTLTGEKICALSESNASLVEIPKSQVTICNVPSGDEDVFVLKMAYSLISHYLLSLGAPGHTLIVYEADLWLAPILREYALRLGVNLILMTSVSTSRDSSLVFIHPLSSQRDLRAILPKDTSTFVDLSPDDVTHATRPNILDALHPHCTYLTRFDVFSKSPILLSNNLIESVELVRTITNAWRNNELAAPTKVTPREILDADRDFEPLTIIDWASSPSISVTVQPVDSTSLFANDKTYVLFGLTSDLAQTLCHWMVQHGARYVVMTSRKPNVQQAWLDRVEALGATVKLFPNDISNLQAVEKVCQTIADTLPPIAGIANGAMVLVDTMIGDLGVASLEAVLKPKVNGSANLERIFANTDLDFFIMLSSITAIYGNEGQSNYGAANMFMTSLAYQRRSRGRAASILHIGPITGSGYITREASENVLSWVKNHGHCLLSERDFLRGFAEAIVTGRPESGLSPEIVLDERAPIVDLQGESQELDDPKFQHVLKQMEVTDGMKDGTGNSVSVKTRLMTATSPDQLYENLRDAFLGKLQIILQLSADDVAQDSILDQGANDLGIDSLIAVDLRTWFLKELDIDMPVLKILGGTSVRDLLAFTLEKLPEKLTSTLPFKIRDRETGIFPIPAPSSSDKSSISLETFDVDQDNRSRDSGGQADSVISSVSASSKDRAEKSHVHQLLPQFIRTEEMSFAQARFWSMMAMLEDPATLNIACLVRMTGNIRTPDLERAVQYVAQRHEALRTCFFEDENHRPMQGILPSPLVRLEKRQIREGESSHEFENIKNYIFDVQRGETMRVILLSETPVCNFIIIIHHHIVMDGVSFEIFLADLQKVYNGQSLSSRLLQYPDFSSRQRKDFQSGGMDSELRFWRKEFPNIPSPLPLLPFSETHSRRTLTRFDFNSVNHTIPGSLAVRIKTACRKYKTTPFHFFLATYKTLLFRLLRSEDLCIGMADANRLDSDVLNSIGCYLNLLPLRFTAKRDQKFSDAIQEARAKSYAAIANSKVPFDVLLEDLRVPRSSLHSPLFQAFINYRQGVVEKRSFGESLAEAQEYLIARGAYDVSLDIIDNPSGDSTVSFMVQKDLYASQDAKILMECYVRLLDAFSHSPDLELVVPTLYAMEELNEAIQLGQGPTTPCTWQPTLIHHLDDIIRDHGHKLALKDGLGNHFSYKEMGQRVNIIASALLSKILPGGSSVAVFQEPSVDWVCSMLAIMRIGAVYVPLDLRISIPRLQEIVKDCKPTAIIVHALTREIAVDLDASSAEIIDLSSIQVPSVVVTIQTQPGDPATILYTSGSTGIPKGIVLKHSNLVNEIEDSVAMFNLSGHCILQQSALSFDMSLWQTFNALANGGSLYVVSNAHRADPVAITKLISSEKITVTCATPSEYVSWLRAGIVADLRSSHWNFAMMGGEQVTDSHLYEFRELEHPQLRLFNGYGPTEVTFVSNKVELPYRDAPDSQGLLEKIPAGFTSRNCSVYILSEDLQLVPVGFPGEIFIGGAGVALGYLNNEDLTTQKFLPDPYPSSGSKEWKVMHRTGDRGRFRKDGALIVEGRIDGDTQIKLRGIRIDLQDIENTIIRTAKRNLLEATVSVRGDPQLLIAHVVFSHDYSSTSKESFLQRLLSSLPLPQYMCPAVMIPLKSLPINDHGKVDRRSLAALPLPESLRRGDKYSDKPLTETELRLRRCWEEILSSEIIELHEISPDADFFHVGGNSGLLVRLHKSIQQTFGVVLPLVELFETSTLSRMATKIERTAREIVIDWVKETAIDRTFFENLPSSILQTNSNKKLDGKVILLTGATGNLGREILRQLVASPAVSTIHCVAIRSSETPPARTLSISSPKIIAHFGDLTAPDLGLSSSEFEIIAATTDTIIHSGAQRSFWEYYQVLKASNVSSTQALVRLAKPRKIPIHFLSSGGVFSLTNMEIHEGSVAKFPPPADGANGYVASKWASERYLEKAATELGVPVCIHRTFPAPDIIMKDPPTEVMDEFLRLAKCMNALPSRDGWTGAFDLLPLDKVADKIGNSAVASAVSSRAEGDVRYIHHYAEVKISAQKLFEMVEAGFNIGANTALSGAERIPAIEWVGRAKKAGLRYMLAAHDLIFDVDGGGRNEGLVLKR